MRDGREIKSVDVGGGRVGDAEEMGNGAGTTADVEEAVGVVEGALSRGAWMGLLCMRAERAATWASRRVCSGALGFPLIWGAFWRKQGE